MSHRQHQAGCPPTVQRGSGRSPRWRQRSGLSRSTPSRSPISASPTGSCFVCWSAMERRRLFPVGKAMPWEPALAAIGYPFGGTRIRAGLSSRGAVPDPQAGGVARRPAGGEGTNPAGRPARAVLWVHWETRGPSAGSLGVATRTTSRQTAPTRGPRDYRDPPYLVGR
jgi:hypothetical protein